MVLANLMYAGSGELTENSLYPWWARKDGISLDERPAVDDVRKYDTVCWIETVIRPGLDVNSVV